MICKICQQEFEKERSLHSHLKVHDMGVDDYYTSFFPRFDVMTNQPIPFLKKDQYFSQEFTSKHSIDLWHEKKTKEEKGKYFEKRLKEEKEKRDMKFMPSSSFFSSLGVFSTGDIINCIGSVSSLAKSADLKMVFNKRLDDKFWEGRDIEIFVDTREQHPYSFASQTENKLDFGDYTAAGEDYCKVFVDRKSISDFYGTFGRDINRFERELKRCREFNSTLIVVAECTLDSLEEYSKDYNHGKTFSYIMHNIRKLLAEYSEFQIIFAVNRAGGKKITKAILSYGEDIKNIDVNHYIEEKIYGTGKRHTRI